MNTFLRIVCLIVIIGVFYVASILTINIRYENKKEKTKKVLNIFYYVISIVLIVTVMFFSFPTYIFLAWNKLILLAAILGLWFTIQYLGKNEEAFTFAGVIIMAIAICVFCDAKITGKEQFEEPIVEINLYDIAISSVENSNVAVQKIEDDGNQYYVLTYFDKNQKPVFVKTPVSTTELLIDYDRHDVAKIEVKETLICYNHTEITDEGNNFTYEDEVNYKINISDNLCYDE